jgi:hypothetical protein
MVDLNGHEAGNGGHSQGNTYSLSGLLYSERRLFTSGIRNLFLQRGEIVAKRRTVNEALSPANHQRLSHETEQRVDTWNTPQVSSRRTLDRRE